MHRRGLTDSQGEPFNAARGFELMKIALPSR
jgi:hypothetical protein